MHTVTASKAPGADGWSTRLLRAICTRAPKDAYAKLAASIKVCVGSFLEGRLPAGVRHALFRVYVPVIEKVDKYTGASAPVRLFRAIEQTVLSQLGGTGALARVPLCVAFPLLQGTLAHLWSYHADIVEHEAIVQQCGSFGRRTACLRRKLRARRCPSALGSRLSSKYVNEVRRAAYSACADSAIPELPQDADVPAPHTVSIDAVSCTRLRQAKHLVRTGGRRGSYGRSAPERRRTLTRSWRPPSKSVWAAFWRDGCPRACVTRSFASTCR